MKVNRTNQKLFYMVPESFWKGKHPDCNQIKAKYNRLQT